MMSMEMKLTLKVNLDKNPHFPTQEDLVKDLGLTKSNPEILRPHLKEWKLLEKTCSYRKRNFIFASFFKFYHKKNPCAAVKILRIL